MAGFYQILAPDGKVSSAGGLTGLGLTGEDCISLYEKMLLTRFFAEQAVKEARKEFIPLYISPRGQEAAEVGSAFALRPSDGIFAYARSQGGAFTKGVLPETMFKLFRGVPDPDAVKDLLSRKVMLPYVLVGVHLTHASGFAWARKILRDEAIAAAYFGDGATAQGDFHSALNFASVFKIPAVFICENNQFAISTPTSVQTATETFAEKARGYNVPNERVDGNDVFGVYGAMRRAVARARVEKIPTLIEAVTYRLDPHTTAIGAIREAPPAELAEAEGRDPLTRMRAFLLSSGFRDIFGSVWTEREDEALRTRTFDAISAAAKAAREKNRAMFDGPALIRASAELHARPAVSPHWRRLTPASFTEKVLKDTPAVIPQAPVLNALNFAHFDAMTFDHRVVTLGEDVGDIGSVFRTAAIPEWFAKAHLPPELREKILAKFLSLREIFGPERAIDTPLDEEGIVGHAVGLAMGGLRVIPEIQFSGFVFEAANQIVAELGQIPHISGGLVTLPVVIRLPYGGGKFIQHHRDFEVPYFLNNPGLRIVVPSTVQDFYDLFLAAVASEYPVLFFEDKNLYRREELKEDLVRRPPEKALEEFGVRVAREGSDLTILAYGRLVYEALKAAALLEEKNIRAEVVDIRVFAPLDKAGIAASVKKTGRLVIVQEEPVFGGSGAELAASIYESEAFHYLSAPLRRIGPPRTYHPPMLMWEDYIPSAEDIVRAAEEVCA